MVATPVVGATSQVRLTSYITVDQFKSHRRRGVQVDNLVPRGRPDEQDAALAEVIESASAELDNIILQVLAATVDTEVRQCSVDRKGFVKLHPRYRPVIQLNSFALGSRPDNMATYPDLSGCAVQPEKITVPVVPLTLTSSAGPLQFGTVAPQQDQAWCQYTYVNGFPVTTLTAPALVGDTLLHIADTTGIIPGKTFLTIYDLQRRERFVAGAVSVATGPGTVACPALAYAHPNSGNYQTGVSALPPDVIEAMVLLCRAIIKDPGGGNVSAATRNAAPSKTDKDPFSAGDDIAEAEAKLHPYLVPVE